MRSQANKKLAAIIAFSLCAIGVSVFLFAEIFRETRKNAAIIARLKTQISAEEQKRALSHEAKTLLSDRKDDIAKIENTFVDKNTPVEFIESIEALARRTRNTMSLEIDSANSDDARLGFRLTLEALEKNTFDFLTLLELLPYHISITEINFQKIASASLQTRETDQRKIVEKSPDTRLFLQMFVAARDR
ncbi:MAG: hypothetical protein HYZ69_00780 [Candidatus Colwellbacteria bacterium]|nr:hypothetical protein [Candidatus Colwellbacteria bacterium]